MDKRRKSVFIIMVAEAKKKRSDFKSALRYICVMEFGYESDLEKNVDAKRIEEFKSCGFISNGKNIQSSKIATTWRVSATAKNYFRAKYGMII